MPRLALVSLLLAFLASAATAQTPTWRVEFLGELPAGLSGVAAVAVNDARVVVGNGWLSGYKRAWIASPDLVPETLPLPEGANWAQAYDMNRAGVVAGSVLIGGFSQAVIWRPDAGGYEAVLLENEPGELPPFDARGINDRGDVVGKLGVFDNYYWNETEGIVPITTAEFPVVPDDINNQRQILGDTYRMDLDDFVLEDLGNPTGTTYNYMFTELTSLNDIGEAAGYAVVATSQPPYVPVRFTDGEGWKLFNSFPWSSANALGLAASGDTVFQLGSYFGNFVYVEGFGSLSQQGTLGPDTDWDISGSFTPAISPGSLLGCTGTNPVTAETGVVLLTPVALDDLGGAAAGALGHPVLGGYGSLVPGELLRLRFCNGAPGALSYLCLSVASNPIPLLGGVFHPTPGTVFVPITTDALGRWDLTFEWPPAPVGATLYLQVAVIDPEAIFGKSLSNAVAAVTQ